MKKVLKHIRILIPVLLLILIILVIPQLNSSELMNSTQTGKALGFLWGMLGYVLVMLVVSTTSITKTIKITSIDVLLGILSLIVLVSYWLHPGDQLRILTFIALVIFYLSIRALNQKYVNYILLALVISGSVQAIYGNMQLWGYFPSNHGIFKMTGSFFNPGPYSGYLAAVFPVSLGLFLCHKDCNFPVSVLSGLMEKLVKLFEVLGLKSLMVKLFEKKEPEIPQTRSIEPETSNLSNPFEKLLFVAIKYLSLMSIIAILLVLPAARSRAAWLAVLASSAYLLSVKYQLNEIFRAYFNTPFKKVLIITLAIVCPIIFGLGLYHFKKGSADGRRLIWKVSTDMIKEKPFFGYGDDGFKMHYMDYQAAYFKNNPDSKEAMVAGDTNYAFNEFLQLTVENGLVGLLLTLVILIGIFTNKRIIPPLKHPSFLSNYEVSNPQTLKLSNNQTIKQLNTLSYTNSEVGLTTDSIRVICRAVILSIIVFGLFSYPMQILPIKICLVVALAIAASALSEKEKSTLHLSVIPNNSWLFVVKSLASVGCIGLFWLAASQLQQIRTAYTDWQSAFDTYNMGIYDDCLPEYEKAYPILKTNGDFLTNYGKALSIAEKHDQAIEVLQLAAKYYPNTIVYTALGDSYKKLKKNTDAEQAYIHAWQMNPSRFYPKYLLAKLYNETGQTSKAKNLAKELLEKEVKIESTAIEEIKEEMEKIIDNQIKI